jgi:hypothetical protein
LKAVIPLNQRDADLLRALRPYLGNKSLNLVDTLLELLENGVRDSDGNVVAASVSSLRIEAKRLVTNAYSLFLILILLLLADDGETARSVTDPVAE